MKKSLVAKSRVRRSQNRLQNNRLENINERGVTIVLVAMAMVAIIGMAALSIDVITLYLAREEAQRSADAAALAAAKIISESGITGDPSNSTLNWGSVCGTNGIATKAATAMAGQNAVGNLAASTVNVTYSAGGTTSSDCTTLSSGSFGINPLVTVQLTRPSLPTFFSRIWGYRGNSVSASATAEAFNSSNSGTVNQATPGTLVPVQPRCVKPWAVPNLDPFHGTSAPPQNGFVSATDGSIANPGISLGGGVIGSPVIGETFWLVPDCVTGAVCTLLGGVTPVQPTTNYAGGVTPPPLPNVLYVPAQVTTTPVAIPSCATEDAYTEAVGGCDQPTNYTCGVPLNNVVDLTNNPITPTVNGLQCLTRQGAMGNPQPSGQDYLNPYAAPSAYPFQILAGSSNPTGLSGNPISYSNSIVSLPIFDQTSLPTGINTTGTTAVTFVGFLQVFVNEVDANGDIRVTVLNVSGCGNGGTTPVAGTPVIGNSSVPIRLVTPP